MGDYEATLAEKCVPVGKAVNANVACVTPMMCAPTEEEALARGLEGGNFFGYSLGHYYVFGDHVPGETDVWKEYIERRAEVGYSAGDRRRAERGATRGQGGAPGDATGLRGATGTPEQIREYLAPLRGCRRRPADLRDAGRASNRHEDICESLELFGREVLPEFKERDERVVGEKARRLAPVVDRAMARRVDDAPPLPADYNFPAMPRAWADTTHSQELSDFLEKLADDRAAGRRDTDLGILG